MFKNDVNLVKRSQSLVSVAIIGGVLALGTMSFAIAKGGGYHGDERHTAGNHGVGKHGGGGHHGIGKQEEPYVYLIKYVITGSPNPDQSYTINGPGYSTITTSSGQVLDNIVPGLQVSQLSGAKVVFSGDLMNDPIIPFTCEKGTCNITLGGSTFTSDAGVPLDGRVVPMWGPIINSEFNQDGSSTPIRILGCGGLKEISGAGKFAGMVGSICFNGTFTVPDFQTNFTLKGGSDCTITLHTPVVPIP